MTFCRECGGPQMQEYVDTGTMDGRRSWLPGRWDPCPACGNMGQPMAYEMVAPYWPARETGPQNGPAAPFPLQPTPEDILRGAGLTEGLLD